MWGRWAVIAAWRVIFRRPAPRAVDLRGKLIALERAEARGDRDRQEQIWREIYGLEEEAVR